MYAWRLAYNLSIRQIGGQTTKLLNSITYYQLSQYAGIKPSASFFGAETYMAMPKLIEVLQSGSNAVLGYGYYNEEGDRVL